MENKPLFSVLIANYNNGKYLQEAVDSVKNQTYENWEIVIVDDGSTDNSIDIYKKLKTDDRIRIYSNDKNSGVGFTKRRLCELAKGEIAGFLDADDALVDSALYELVNSHIKNNNASLIYSTLFYCDEFLRIVKKKTLKPIPKHKTALDYNVGIISHFVTFKVDKYYLTEGINAWFKLAEDKDLYYKLEEVGSIFFIDLPLYKYRVHSGGISRVDKSIIAAWSLFAKYEAYKRRCLDPTQLFTEHLKTTNDVVNHYENSIDYKIGNWFLKPLRYVKYNLIHRNNS